MKTLIYVEQNLDCGSCHIFPCGQIKRGFKERGKPNEVVAWTNIRSFDTSVYLVIYLMSGRLFYKPVVVSLRLGLGPFKMLML